MALTVQQQLVLEMLANNLNSAFDATDKMRLRASTLFAASAGLMSFVSAAEMIGDGSPLQSTFVGASIVSGVFVAYIGIQVYTPTKTPSPGSSSNATDLRDSYIDVTEEEAVNQIVSDRASCFSDAKSVNATVGRSVRQMALGFLCQVICVACAIFCRVFVVPS